MDVWLHTQEVSQKGLEVTKSAPELCFFFFFYRCHTPGMPSQRVTVLASSKKRNGPAPPARLEPENGRQCLEECVSPVGRAVILLASAASSPDQPQPCGVTLGMGRAETKGWPL